MWFYRWREKLVLKTDKPCCELGKKLWAEFDDWWGILSIGDDFAGMEPMNFSTSLTEGGLMSLSSSDM